VIIVQRQPRHEYWWGQRIDDKEAVMTMLESLVCALEYPVDFDCGMSPYSADVISVPYIWMHRVPHYTAERIPYSLVAQGALSETPGFSNS
jgi:hypothetical protein